MPEISPDLVVLLLTLLGVADIRRLMGKHTKQLRGVVARLDVLERRVDQVEKRLPPGAGPGSDPRIRLPAAGLFLAVTALGLLTGCNQDRQEATHATRSQSERTHYQGTVSLPLPAAEAGGQLAAIVLPVDLVVDRTLSEGSDSAATAHTETTAPPWVGQLLAQAAGRAVSVATGGGWGGGEVAALITAGSAAAAGIAGWSQARKRAAEHKADADEAWDKLAAAAPPKGT